MSNTQDDLIFDDHIQIQGDLARETIVEEKRASTMIKRRK